MKPLPLVILSVLMAAPSFAGTVTAGDWETISQLRCADANDWHSPAWDAVDKVDDQIINHVCKTRLVYAECISNPRMTIGQALASIHYKIEFGGRLPVFRCGA